MNSGMFSGPFVVSNTTSDACGKLLKKQLKEDRCWSPSCTDILKSRPLILYGLHRLTSSMSRFFEGDIILNPFRAVCPVCSSLISLKRDNNVAELISHVQISHPTADHCLEFIQLASSNLFHDSIQGSTKLAVNCAKDDENSAYKMPRGM